MVRIKSNSGRLDIVLNGGITRGMDTITPDHTIGLMLCTFVRPMLWSSKDSMVGKLSVYRGVDANLPFSVSKGWQGLIR
uniref:Uncharacterized protein n=1 Tax=Setaria italica TaxID=4555 RepID=K3XNX0_SETIT